MDRNLWVLNKKIQFISLMWHFVDDSQCLTEVHLTHLIAVKVNSSPNDQRLISSIIHLDYIN